MRLRDCHNFNDFRELARRRLPGPIFDYIAGGADDEVTLRQNTASFEPCDLVPNVLRGVEAIDISVKVMGQNLQCPFIALRRRCSDYSITTANARSRRPRQNLVLCSAYLRWVRSVWKSCARRTIRRRSISSISTKIGRSITP